MKQDDIVIVAAKRTPIGNFLGQLSPLSAPQLGACAHTAVIEQAGIAAADIDEIISGCVLQAGLGQAPARQAAIAAKIPMHVGATTVNKMCGSGMKAVMLAHDLICAQSAKIVLASGMESMSNAPYLLSKARAGYRMGHGELIDAMFRDGLEDAYDKGKLMGYFAQKTAERFHFTRDQQDAYAICSLMRALEAQKNGNFNQELIPVTVTTRQGDIVVTQDEGPDDAKIAKIPNLKPAFQADGSVTAANSSSISDGAASLLLMTAAEAAIRNIKPLAKIVAHTTYSAEPQWFTTAPVGALKKLFEKTEWKAQDVDLYEINEAFAVVALAAIQELNLDVEKVNIHGGACALGHPIGASGARILVTLLYALQQQNKKRGVAALCIGGGEATAMAVEML